MRRPAPRSFTTGARTGCRRWQRVRRWPASLITTGFRAPHLAPTGGVSSRRCTDGRYYGGFSTAEDLVNAAKDRAARCLTPAQRAAYFLPAAPPLWCIERRLWPYNSDEWRVWLD